jgi:RsbT co-antagonist protein rsbRD N-terminal domain
MAGGAWQPSVSTRSENAAMKDTLTVIPSLIDHHEPELLSSWLACQRRSGAIRTSEARDPVTADQSKRFLAELRRGAEGGDFEDITTPPWASTRAILEDVSRDRLNRGFSARRRRRRSFFLLKSRCSICSARRLVPTRTSWEPKSGLPRNCSTSSDSTPRNVSRLAVRR